MAKKKAGKASKGGKAVPKSIAGVKVPKELRKAGNRLAEAAQSPVGREVLVTGLAAAATAAATAFARSDTVRKALDKAVDKGLAEAGAAKEQVEKARAQAGDWREMIAPAAAAALDGLFKGLGGKRDDAAKAEGNAAPHLDTKH